LVAIPPLAAGVVVAPQLFEVMYGTRWLVSVPVFQVLCLATMVRLMTAHANQANEAKGRIWRQVWQKVPYVAMIVLGVWAGSYWGITGAACGVLAARMVLAVLVQRLLRESLQAAWREMLSPMVPGVVLAAVVAALALVVELLVRQVLPSPPALALLATQSLVLAIAYLLLVLYSPFGAVRDAVRETVLDFAPRFAKWLPAPITRGELTKVV
jgi:PST family polysaccharide transporter